MTDSRSSDSMNWTKLLSPLRFGEDAVKPKHGSRTDFERDYDRILFSSPFRRLRGKTQVFPMPENDHVHTRMTHSLEVASVGRSLGKGVGDTIIQRHKDELADFYHYSDFGDIVAAACLAHDIGNPPFGHSGEDAIAHWFEQEKNTKNELFQHLDPAQIHDLCHFEGNAQGLRILTQLNMYRAEGGMRLTYATLGTFAKYPQESLLAGSGSSVSQKKFTFFQSEKDVFEKIALQLGLLQRGSSRSWCRHPLSYLVEAADDICYTVLDAEDGYLLGHFHYDELYDLFLPLLHKPEELSRFPDERSRVSRMRALVIGRLVEETRTAFLEHESALLSGTLDSALIDIVPSGPAMSRIVDACNPRCYNAPEVLQILLAGYRVIGDFLDRFVPAALGDASTRLHRQTLGLLPPAIHETDDVYQRMLIITDFIAGMTDSYAMNLYRSLNGIAMPSVNIGK
ncbi:MAG: deoxyguanosinetriphosphate triphosphohydrolase [Planctomycetes bacterium]|nr:deoxyguanosinetriphosphate triphosphohydrolase [Planctomycetota bacterium]